MSLRNVKTWKVRLGFAILTLNNWNCIFIFQWLCDNIPRMTRFLITRDYQEIDKIDFWIRSMTMNSRQTHSLLYDELKWLCTLTMTVFSFDFEGYLFSCRSLNISLKHPIAAELTLNRSDKNDQLLIIFYDIFSYENVWREYKSELYLFSKFGIPVDLWQCRILPTHD